MVIFYSYVSLPEGIAWVFDLKVLSFRFWSSKRCILSFPFISHKRICIRLGDTAEAGELYNSSQPWCLNAWIHLFHGRMTIGRDDTDGFQDSCGLAHRALHQRLGGECEQWLRLGPWLVDVVWISINKLYDITDKWWIMMVGWWLVWRLY